MRVAHFDRLLESNGYNIPILYQLETSYLGNFWVVISSFEAFGIRETMVFAADSSGNFLDSGSPLYETRDTLDHMVVLGAMGYEIG